LHAGGALPAPVTLTFEKPAGENTLVASRAQEQHRDLYVEFGDERVSE